VSVELGNDHLPVPAIQGWKFIRCVSSSIVVTAISYLSTAACPGDVTYI
jgi:hypothetical protein